MIGAQAITGSSPLLPSVPVVFLEPDGEMAHRTK